jgi:transcriptional regulator with XRE-family HTH domain
MKGQTPDEKAMLTAKVARLVEEHGWSQEEFVRRSGLHRHTVRALLHGQSARRPRNNTIARCAQAFGLSVHELRGRSLESLLPCSERGWARPKTSPETWLYDQATQPELLSWVERNPERAGRLTSEEIDELLSLQGTGGPLTSFGVDHYVELLERKRKLIERIHAIAGTEYLELLDQFVTLLYDRIQPYPDR